MSTPAADTAEYTDDAYGGAYLATFEFTRNLIAACPTFYQDILGVENPEEAREKIYKQETLAERADTAEVGASEADPTPELEPRPYCIILDDTRSRPRAGVGEWGGEGAVIVVFEVPIPSELIVDHGEDDDGVRRDKFRRLVKWRVQVASRIEQEITELSGSADAAGNPYLNVVEPELIVPPSDPAEDVADKPFIGFAFRLRWK